MQKKTWGRWVTINLMAKNQIYFPCLVCLSWRWHAWCARSHGNSTWCILCVTRHREGWVAALSVSQQAVKASFPRMFACWELLDSCSEKLMRYVFQLPVRWIPSVLHHILKLQFSPMKTPYMIISVQSKMAFNILRQCSRALSQSTHFPVELAYLSLYFLHRVKHRFKGEKQEKQKEKILVCMCTYLPILTQSATTINNLHFSVY